MASQEQNGSNARSASFGRTSRRGSIDSISSRAGLDQETLTHALDEIHSSASRSTVLTTFNDFAAPPTGASRNDNETAPGLVQNSLGGFYARLKSSIGAGTERPRSPLRIQHQARSSDGGDSASYSSRPLSRQSGDQLQKPALSSQTLPASHSPLHGEKDSSSSVRDAKTSAIPDTGPAQSARSSVSDASPFTDLDKLSDQASINNLSQATGSRHATASTTETQSNVESLKDILTKSREPAYPKDQDALKASDITRAKSFLEVRNGIRPKRPPLPTLLSVNTLGSGTSSVTSLHKEGDVSPARSITSTTNTLPPSFDLESGAQAPSSLMHEMRRKVLSRDFWMKDENAKVCFNCGDSFTTFRRKHHCRTCGQIYDAKCTILIPGRLFDQPGRLRICKTCESIMMGDESSDYSEDEEPPPTPHGRSIRFSGLPPELSEQKARASASSADAENLSNPLRNPYDPRRRLASIPGDANLPTLKRPSSSRSLKSLNTRPRSSSNRYRRSRHQHIRSLGLTPDLGAPFQRGTVAGEHTRDSSLPAFHTDSIIDPDLAPYLSDEGSSDGDHQSIAGVVHGDTDGRSTFGGLLGAIKKVKSRPTSRATFDLNRINRDTDAVSISSSHTNQRRRPLGVRTLSTGSMIDRHAFSPRLSWRDSAYVDRPMSSLLLQSPEDNVPGDFANLGASRLGMALTNCSPPAAELNSVSSKHVSLLLRQFLQDAKIEHARRWEKVLVPILLRCAEDVDPNIHRGDDIDIRHYVKLKKAPSGQPKDTAYVSGVVFTKNIAIKGMSRSVKEARLLLISFPLIYARHQQHFMSLDPVIAQEREYLRNLVRRIVALGPDVLLVQRTVSGFALDLLKEANITVVCNVKESVLQAISRCTQTRIASSLEKLTMDPSQLGYCRNFDVKTFVYEGMKKTYVFVSGCEPDLGCTIVLRGGTPQTLKKLKWITEFMCYVVYNLKLETSLMRDQFASLPSQIPYGQPEGLQACKERSMPKTPEISQASVVHEKTGTALEYDSMVMDLEKRILSISPVVKLAQPYLLLRGREQEQQMVHMHSRLQEIADSQVDDDSQPTDKGFELVTPDMVFGNPEKQSPQLREALRAIRQSEYDKAAHYYGALKRRWESYVAGSLDPFSPLSHQQIVVLFSIISTSSGNACEGPDLLGLDFYQENETERNLEPDVPLGEYVERLCHQATTTCTTGRCEKKMMDHHRQYVHGDGQLTVTVKNQQSKLRGMEKTILMWSFCRECQQETPAIPMSSNTWKYSFAKYLELSFWSTPLIPRAGFCPHDINRCHIRSFGFNDLVVSFQHDPIRILEVIVPRGAVSWKVEKDLMLKNEQYSRIEERMTKFLTSVMTRIESINLDNVKPDVVEECKSEVEKLQQRVSEEQAFLINKLQDKYQTSRFYEIVPLNRAVRAMQEKVASWDSIFAEFERNYFPSENDIRRLAAQQLKNVYLGRVALPEDDALTAEGVSLDTINEQDGADLVEKSGVQEADSEQASQRSVTSPSTTRVPHSDVSSPLSAQRDLSPNASRTVGVGGASAQHVSAVVEHLDLAMPSASPSAMTGSQLRGDPIPSQPSPQSPPQPSHESPADGKVHETEKARGEHSQQSPKVVTTFQPGLPATPPLLRAQTQPILNVRGRAAGPTTPLPQSQEQASKAPTSAIPVPAKGAGLIGRVTLGDKRSSSRMTSAIAKGSKSALQSMIPRAASNSNPNKFETKVFALAKHFEQMSREFERERLRERRQRAARVREAQVYPTASYQPTVEVFRNADEAVRERDTAADQAADGIKSSRSSLEARSNGESEQPETQTSLASPKAAGKQHAGSGGSDAGTFNSEESTLRDSSDPTELEGALSETEQAEAASMEDGNDKASGMSLEETQAEFLDIPKQDKTSMMKMLTNFWSERSASGWAPLEYPLAPSDHIFADSDVIVREDEPSSLVAFALASQDYRQKLHKFRERAKVQAQTAEAGKPHEDQVDLERTLLGNTATHMKYQFQAGQARMQVKVFYAESFDAIRQKCGVAERFVESLSRCLKWDSQGGKTKSLFLRTLDERFVLKSLSTVETQAFLRFAPDYFDYMSKCLFHNLPSALAKMVGFYQVVIKNPVTGMDFSCFLQVMENVFYDGPTNRMFDLKGSMRNRKVQSTGEKNEVLLDENLLDYISQAPVYVRNHSNSLLASSMSNDTLFCSKQNVMDYSLIVGLYDDRQELMVGIIDYIRTYTWDKKLESWIKDRGKNKPTVRSPKEYRNRFRASISRYFPLAPSCWQVFGTQRTEQPPAWWESMGKAVAPEEEVTGAVEESEPE